MKKKISGHQREEDIPFLKRVDQPEFLKGLCELGFEPNVADAMLRILYDVNKINPVLFAGKSKATIKSALTYATIVYLIGDNSDKIAAKQFPSQRTIAKKFGVSVRLNLYGTTLVDRLGFPANVRRLYKLLLSQYGDIFCRNLSQDMQDTI